MSMIITLLIVASGICWSVVYVDSIRIGFKQKTYAMPLFALGLNIVWEGLYAFTDLFLRRSIGAQAIANAAWFVLDCVIVYTYFKFGREECRTEAERKFFVPWSVLAFAICLVLQLLFYFWFGNVEGEKYAAYLQNVAMSALYLSMLRDRGSDKGQTMTITHYVDAVGNDRNVHRCARLSEAAIEGCTGIVYGQCRVRVNRNL